MDRAAARGHSRDWGLLNWGRMHSHSAGRAPGLDARLVSTGEEQEKNDKGCLGQGCKESRILKLIQRTLKKACWNFKK